MTQLPTHEEIRLANKNYTRLGFEELEVKIKTLMDFLAEILDGRGDLSESIPWRGDEIRNFSRAPEDAASIAQLQAICFEILNMVEERTALKVRHQRRKDLGMAAEQGMWGRVIAQLKQQGYSEGAVLEALADVKVSPVLTAHPTEAKRPTVRERHLALYKDLVRWDRNHGDPVALDSLMNSVKVGLETLWHTGEIHASRPSILAELRNTLYYLREVFPNIVRKLDASLEAAWTSAGWDVKNLQKAGCYPKISFGTWVGGDRDGHPLVTAEVTEDTLLRLGKHARRIHGRELKSAADILTFSPAAADVPEAITRRVLELRKELGTMGRGIAATNAREPWRCLAYLMRENLNRRDGYSSVQEYSDDLALLNDTLCGIGAETTAWNVVHPMNRLVEVFGFHLATLDIRQNSPFHDAAASQMLAMAGVEGAEDFSNWPEEKRADYLLKELQNERPFRPWEADADTEAGKIMDCLRVVREHTDQHGMQSMGFYVISMTRQVSDLLLVHLFAREGGMASWENGLWVSKLPVCPLFETGDDLDRAGDIVKTYLSLPSGEHFLRASSTGNSYMPVMVGYSDSNKDSGMFSGQWSLQKAQSNITAACHEVGARCEFFHGRGGTISRGGGPVQWFLRALPEGSLNGAMRVTEQGEVVPRKYAHIGNATYNLELMLAGVTSVTVKNQGKKDSFTLGEDHYQKMMGWLAEESRKSYRDLLEEPGFIEFYRQATPIDALELGCFGSRPSSRTGTASLDDLRAIPWVFSWTQARFYLPGWFGVGAALEKLKENSVDDFQALAAYAEKEPFLRYLLTNVETNLASADVDVMSSYADLVTDKELRERFKKIILPEFHRTGEMINQIFGSSCSVRRPRMLKTLAMRGRPLRLLHEQQVSLLGGWREAQKSEDGANQEQLLNALQYSVNAIASGLRTTG